MHPFAFFSLQMSTTTQKHSNFISEPMGDKPVTELAGIGETLGGRLKDKGFDKVNELILLNQKLMLNMY